MRTAIPDADPGAGARAAVADPGFGIYVHWPFCRAKCPYCDFNSHVSAEVDHARWAQALRAEIDRHADDLGPRTLRSIFFGGGTPSLMAPQTVAAVIERATARFAPAPDLEIIAPVREHRMSREEQIEWAAARSVPVPVTKASSYSTDENLWGRSTEAGILEDPRTAPTERRSRSSTRRWPGGTGPTGIRSAAASAWDPTARVRGSPSSAWCRTCGTTASRRL